MRLSIILLFVTYFVDIYSHETVCESLKYTIRPIANSGDLEVDLEFTGNQTGSTELVLPSSFMGENNLEREVTQLACLSRALKIEDTDKAHIKHISHNPNEKLTVTYRMHTGDEKRGWGRSYLEKNYFHFVGRTFFIVPTFSVKKDACISLKFEGFPADWMVANSFGMQELRKDLIVPLDTFLGGLFLGGDLKFLDCGIENSSTKIVLRKGSQLPETLLVDSVKAIIKTQRTFWDDHEFPYYLVSICEVDEKQYQGGTEVLNALIVYMRDYSLSRNQKESLNWLNQKISHEHFHIWNFSKICFEPTEDYVRWFTEGFTEYYAFTLNLRSNLMDVSEYREKFNSIIGQYSSSPARNATDKEVQKLFWENRDIQRLPYTKGCLFALYLDWKIRSQTLGTRSLDDVMRNLLKEMQKRDHRPFSQKELQIFLGQQIDNVDQDIEKYIINGETLPLESAAFDLRIDAH